MPLNKSHNAHELSCCITMKRPFQCFLKVAPWSSEHADGKIHGGDMDDDPLGKKVEPCLPIYLCKLPQNLFPQIQVFFSLWRKVAQNSQVFLQHRMDNYDVVFLWCNLRSCYWSNQCLDLRAASSNLSLLNLPTIISCTYTTHIIRSRYTISCLSEKNTRTFGLLFRNWHSKRRFVINVLIK